MARKDHDQAASGDDEERTVTTEVSAGLATWSPFQLNFKRTMSRRWQERGRHFHEAVIEASGMAPDEAQEAIEANEYLSDAYMSGGEKATRTPDPDFRKSLAQLVAAGLRDDAVIDEAAYS